MRTLAVLMSITPDAALEQIAAHPRGDDWARLVHTVAFAAADERRTTLAHGLAEVAARAGLASTEAEIGDCHVLRALERGVMEPIDAPVRVMLGALLARGVALSPPKGADAEARVVEALLWLATHTCIDSFPAIDAAMGDRTDGLFRAVAVLVRRADNGSVPSLGRAGVLVGAAALRQSASAVARDEAKALGGELHDPAACMVLAGTFLSSEAEPTVVSGEISSPPRHPVLLVLLGITGVLLAIHVAGLIARIALRYRRPAELRVTARGVTLRSTTEVLGRVVREREAVIPVESLLRATREVRYPRILLYVGLLALALGSYFGVAFFIDGARAGSPELLGIGALLVAGGVGLDFLLENVRSGIRGRCRVIVWPRKGPATAIGEVEPAAADSALKRLVAVG